MHAPNPYRDRFDPEVWGLLHDGADAGPATWIFRRGMELAREEWVARRSGAAGDASAAPWLDLGCGGGHLTAILAALGPVVGIDHDVRMLRLARGRRETSSAASGAPRPVLVVARAEALPLRARSVAGVAAVSLLGCLRDATPLVREAARVLRPGGVFVLTITNRASLLRRAERFVTLLGPSREAAGDPVRPYAYREIARALADAGFAVERVRPYGFHLQLGARTLPSFTLSQALERRVGGVAGRILARNLLLVARRS